jgi:hypothetical protein
MGACSSGYGWGGERRRWPPWNGWGGNGRSNAPGSGIRAPPNDRLSRGCTSRSGTDQLIHALPGSSPYASLNPAERLSLWIDILSVSDHSRLGLPRPTHPRALQLRQKAPSLVMRGTPPGCRGLAPHPASSGLPQRDPVLVIPSVSLHFMASFLIRPDPADVKISESNHGEPPTADLLVKRQRWFWSTAATLTWMEPNTEDPWACCAGHVQSPARKPPSVRWDGRPARQRAAGGRRLLMAPAAAATWLGNWEKSTLHLPWRAARSNRGKVTRDCRIAWVACIVPVGAPRLPLAPPERVGGA